ncbi:MAG: urate oxidase [Oscillochloris sp.]|nr:urate oxidase [Oscillochloris sp.]
MTQPTGEVTLADAEYGKSEVRLLKLRRDGPRHAIYDLNVAVRLHGDFAHCYVDGDNRDMPATDTMRNTIYVAADEHPLDSGESFALALAERLCRIAPPVNRAAVQITAYDWDRLPAGKHGHDHAFIRGAGEATARAVVGRDGIQEVAAGIDNVLVLKSTATGWANFHRDELTTLPDTDDRILATIISAEWSYGARADLDFVALWASVREQILTSFADHYSPSVQHTLYRIGRDVIRAHPEVRRIRMSLPNKHHLRFDLTPFGRENTDTIFYVTDAPYGLISGTVERT